MSWLGPCCNGMSVPAFIVMYRSWASMQDRLEGRDSATYASSVSFGHTEHCFLIVWTPKYLGQDLLMMSIHRKKCMLFHSYDTNKAVTGLKTKICVYI